MAKKPDLLPGTLDMLILKTLTRAPLHGYGIALSIKRISDDRDIYLTPLTPSSSVWGHGRGFSEDIA